MAMKYDPESPTSIMEYGRKMENKTFRQIYEAAAEEGILVSHPTDYAAKHADRNYKGGLGNLIEECYFQYASNSDPHADFYQAGVELKVTPFKKSANGQQYSAKERLILTMIDYSAVTEEESFEKSHVWKKSRLMLLVWYLYEKGKVNLDFLIHYVRLFTPPPEDLKIIKEDYDKIVAKIRAGKAHELSEGDTLYLGAATKSSDSSVRRPQPFSDEPAKPRAFSLKNSYMTYVLNHYILPGVPTYEESIIKKKTELRFEDYVMQQINTYSGVNVINLCAKFNVDLAKKPKNLESILAFRILGIKGNHAEEFEKANIVVKTIRVNAKGTIKECMSFPTFKFTELVQETWEDSTFGNYLRETRFLFVVYKYSGDNKKDLAQLSLQGCQFWNIPYDDLEHEVRAVWERAKGIIQDGLIFHIDKNGRFHSNLPKQSENRVAHVRPHGQNNSDTDVLPDGRRYPKQCFWLNNSYILSQLEFIYKQRSIKNEKI